MAHIEDLTEDCVKISRRYLVYFLIIEPSNSISSYITPNIIRKTKISRAEVKKIVNYIGINYITLVKIVNYVTLAMLFDFLILIQRITMFLRDSKHIHTLYTLEQTDIYANTFNKNTHYYT